MRFDYDYVIVGGGMSADTAARGIRELDPDGSVVILSEDVDEPYERPPLSKDLWRDEDRSPDSAYLGTAEAARADVRLSTRVTSLDRSRHVVTANDDDEYGYRTLLLATGGRPRELNLPPSPRVVYYRSFGDYHRTRELADEARAQAGDPDAGRVIVVGGGYIGTEVAAGLAMAGAPVTYLTSDPVPGATTYPEVLARRIEARYAEHGVDVITKARAKRLEQTEPDRVLVHAEVDGSPVTLSGIGVVVGFGIEPNIELAVAAGIEVDEDQQGVVVDEALRTSDPDVFASGDIALYPDRLLGTRRVEHVDHAQQSGRTAGRNMAASALGNELGPYEHTPFYYSDIFDLGYEAVGVLDASLDLVEDWAPGAEGDTGVVYYVGTEESGDAGKLKGVLLWNVWDSTDRARELLDEFREPGSVTGPDTLRGRIPTT